jgi:L-ascorbate metabolism protein UlaG (beta-lactamase superfamily)
MQDSHIAPAESYRLFEILNPVRALGVHWGTFRLSFEGIDDPPREIAALDRGHGRFVTTQAGQSIRVPAR